MEQETRIAVVGIIVENKEAVGEVNQILHDYSPYIIGRMGLPYEKKHVNIISVIVDAPADRISALSGKLGKIRTTSITPTPSSSIRNLFNCIHTPPISLLDLLIPAAGIFRRAAKT